MSFRFCNGLLIIDDTLLKQKGILILSKKRNSENAVTQRITTTRFEDIELYTIIMVLSWGALKQKESSLKSVEGGVIQGPTLYISTSTYLQELKNTFLKHYAH